MTKASWGWRKRNGDAVVAEHVARLNGALPHVELNSVDLAHSLRSVLKFARSAGMLIDNQLTDGCVVFGSAAKVAQVMHALLANVSVHAPGAAVTIRSEQHGDLIWLLVEDDGPGIPAEIAHRLFDAGVHGPQSRGEGVGLTIARQLMRSMAGDLRSCPPASSGTLIRMEFTAAGSDASPMNPTVLRRRS